MMKVAAMTERDLDQVAAMERACFSQPWSRGAFEEELAAENAVYLVAREGARVLGYGGMRFAADEYYVDNIAVDPAYRRQGAGRALVAALVERARMGGGAFITLEVRESNVGAVALYKEQGFTVAGRRRGFYEEPREDALLMTKRLDEPG